MAATLVFSGAEMAAGQSCAAESEPNDDVAAAAVFLEAFCVDGAGGRNDTDAYRITIGGDRPTLWVLGVTLAPETSVHIQLHALTLTDVGAVAETNPVYDRAVLAGTTTVPDTILLEPGAYAVFVDAPVDATYRLELATAGPLPPPPGMITDVGAAFVALGNDEVIIPWRIDEPDALSVSSITALIPPGGRLNLRLETAAGELVVETSRFEINGLLSLADLGLAAGEYVIKLTSRDPATPVVVRIVSDGLRDARHEAEPNNSHEFARTIDFAGPVTGRIFGSSDRVDLDHFVLTLPEERLVEARVSGADGITFHLYLVDSSGSERQRRNGNPSLLPALALGPGQHIFRVSADTNGPDVDYELVIEDQGPVSPGAEREPNDDIAAATAFHSEQVVRGAFAGRERDNWQLNIDGALRIWRLQVAGSGIQYVRLFDNSGAEIARANSEDGRMARLSNLLLAPGVHHLEILGTDGDYILRALPIGPPPGTPVDADPAPVEPPLSAIFRTDEVEPNDTLGRAMTLGLDTPRTGLLDTPDDTDLYHFYLAGETRLAVDVQRDATEPTRLRLSRGRVGEYSADWRIAAGVTEPVEVLLPAGDYYLTLTSDDSSEAPYTLTLLHRAYFERPDDLEINDDWFTATPLPADFRVVGALLQNDADWYRLPAVDTESEVAIALGKPRGNITIRLRQEVPPEPDALWPARTMRSLTIDGNAVDGWHGTLPPGLPVLMSVTGAVGPYDLQLSFGESGPESVVGEPPPLEIAIVLTTAEVAAFDRQGQLVEGVVTLTNLGDAELALVLDTHVEELRWRIAMGQSGVILTGGETVDVPIAVEIAPDALDQNPVVVTVTAGLVDGLRTAMPAAEAVITPRIGAPAAGAHTSWPLPDAMLGGFNVAAEALGATSVNRAERLIDGLLNVGGAVQWSNSQLRQGNPTIDLAGDEPQTIVGVTISPSPDPDPSKWLRWFQILASLDGETFLVAAEVELEPISEEQAFLFDDPMEARYIALRPLSSHAPDGVSSGVGISELKAITAPGTLPPIEGPLDIARADRGGHVVRSDPYLPIDDVLVDGTGRISHSVSRDAPNQSMFVIAFANGRAARVTDIVWREAANAGEAFLLSSVEVSVSLEGASGPWVPVGILALPQIPGGEGRLTLSEPIWTRHVRFDFVRQEGQRGLHLPERIEIFEAPVDEGYRSVIGAWGDLRSVAIFEQLAAPSTNSDLEDAPDTLEAATPLGYGITVRDSATLGVDRDWRRIEVPEGGGVVRLLVTNEPSVDVVLSLHTADGTVVPMELSRTGLGAYSYAAWLEAGRYYVEIEEPERSVALVWDTSGSVSGQVQAIFRAVRGFAQDIKPGREEVNFFPFVDNPPRPLLSGWTGDPLTAFTAIHSYDSRNFSSSDAELNLLATIRELAERDGVRAIVLITDGISGGGDRLSSDLWNALDEVRPRIFSLAVSSGATGGDGRALRNKMKDWSNVNGGFYSYLSGQQSIDVNFRRLAAWLRQPASYSVTASLDLSPPEPATLEVVQGEEHWALQGAVEIILDASGSMLARLGGERRIDIAKSVLENIINTNLPESVPFALRVFGQGPPDSCDTNLQVPLAPLDRNAVATAINRVQPTNLARTPIGASLALVPGDLEGVVGPRLVILLTDGEETCEGDPTAAIAALRESGIDVRINIVGFALDDIELEATFAEWAAAGGGAYFSAADGDALAAAMAAALSRGYLVFKDGDVVATGEVGGQPVELPPGTYRVELDDGTLLQTVNLLPRDAVVLSTRGAD